MEMEGSWSELLEKLCLMQAGHAPVDRLSVTHELSRKEREILVWAVRRRQTLPVHIVERKKKRAVRIHTSI